MQLMNCAAQSFDFSRRTFLTSMLAAAAAGGATRRLLADESLHADQVVLNIEPSKEHPRNSEGSFVALKDGRIVFYYTQFYGGAGDHSAAKIVGIESRDGGRTWSQEPHVVVENEAGANVMSVSLLRLASGKIALFYLRKNSLLDCRPYLRISTDEAKTWSEPTLVVKAPGYFVLNNDRVIQLKTGRLIVPVAFHRSKDEAPNDYKSFDGRAIDLWYYSDDEGTTWKEADTWWALPRVTRSGLQEPGVVELADGRLWTFARTDAGSQYGMISTNQGKSWSAPEPTSLASPVSPASIKRLPGSDDLLAIWNDHSGQFEFPKGKRTPLASGISSDGGQTWSKRKLIEQDPLGWYCYTAMHFTDDALLLAYCAGDPKVGHLNRLRIRRIPLAWLTDG
jgi:hypothetical protein